MEQKGLTEAFNRNDIDELSKYWDEQNRPVVRDFLEHVYDIKPMLADSLNDLARKAIVSFKNFLFLHDKEFGESFILNFRNTDERTKLAIFFLEKSGYNYKKAFEFWEEYYRLTDETLWDYEENKGIPVPNTHILQI